MTTTIETIMFWRNLFTFTDMVALGLVEIPTGEEYEQWSQSMRAHLRSGEGYHLARGVMDAAIKAAESLQH